MNCKELQLIAKPIELSDNHFLEALINNKREEYGFCSDKDLKTAKKLASQWGYPNFIGSSKVFFVNGIRNENTRMYHYFKK